MGGKIHRNSLKPGHKILWYEIKEILGQGGFGITYLAYDPNLEKHVAIKEYLPIELSVREGDFSVHPVSDDHEKQYKWGLESFIKEARTLAKFKHPNIVHVFSVTEENNTAYMVMEYERGQSLQEILKGRKTLEEAELLKILIPILGGLELVHKAGFIHRDIKPDNIFIRRDGSPVLLDFGSARQALGEETKTLTSLVSPGYAPFEQYFSKGNKQGEWTDIYGLGATLYRAVTGVAPQDAIDRSNAIINNSKDTYETAVKVGKGKYSERFLAAIDHAIQFKTKDRPQTVTEWKKGFQLPDDPIKEAEAIERTITQPGETALARQQSDAARKQKNTLMPVMIFVFIAALISLVTTIYFEEEINQIIQSIDIDSGGQKEKEEELARQQLAEDERRLAQLEKKRLEKEATERLAKEKRMAEEQKRREEETRLQQQQDIAKLFIGAEEAISQGRLVEPDGNNAFELYLQILEFEPDNEEAIAGKLQVFKKLLINTKSFIKQNKFKDADRALIHANAIEPDSIEVRLIRVKLEDAKKEAERIALEEEQRQMEEQKRKEEEKTKQLAELERQQKEEQKRLEEEKQLVEQERLQKEAETKRLAEQARLAKEAEAKRLVEEKQRAEAEAAKHLELERLAAEEAARKAENTKAGEFVKIPAGTFNVAGKSVTIEAFEMGKYEITQAQWREVMGNNPSIRKNCEKCPVENVTWSNVHDFIQKLNAEAGVNYRLPTVIEFEYACFKGGNLEQCKGSNLHAILDYYRTGTKLYPVDTRQPDQSGLHNMADNAWEWTCSAYSDRYNGSELVCEDVNKKSVRAIRGGEAGPIESGAVVAAYTGKNNPSLRLYNVGFRLAHD